MRIIQEYGFEERRQSRRPGPPLRCVVGSTVRLWGEICAQTKMLESKERKS